MGNIAVVVRALAGPPQTDGQLLAWFDSSRDEAAFAELVRRHGPMVRAACRRVLGPGPDVDDAFQAAFLVLARRGGAVRDARTLGNWLYGVARHVALRQRDRERRRRQHEARAVPPARSPADPGAYAAVDDELGRLPDRLRFPVIACVLEGRAQDEVARALGVSLSTVRRRLDRGLEILRGRLGGHAVVMAALGGAGVSHALAAETARQATRFVSGESAAGAALAQEVLDVMLRAKVQSVAAALVTAVGVAWGVGLVAAQPPGGATPQVGRASPPATAKTTPKGSAPPPAEPDGRLAQLEEELVRLGETLDLLRKRLKDGGYELPPPIVRQALDAHPRVAALLVRRAAIQASLARQQERHVDPDAPISVALRAELAQLDREITAARTEIRPEVVAELRAAARANLEDQVAGIEERVGATRAARDARVLELARLRGHTAATPPANADDRLGQVLRELRELREEVRRLKEAR